MDENGIKTNDNKDEYKTYVISPKLKSL